MVQTKKWQRESAAEHTVCDVIAPFSIAELSRVQSETISESPTIRNKHSNKPFKQTSALQVIRPMMFSPLHSCDADEGDVIAANINSATFMVELCVM